MENYRIFLAEDDTALAGALKKQLESWDYQVTCCRDFRNVAEEFRKASPHLVLMDIGLPAFNGFYWCSEIRKSSRVPVIFISSASDNMNIVMAMNMGGDDFVAKPFDMDVLLAKIRAMLRRSYDFSEKPICLEHRGAVLNTGDQSLETDGKKVELTRNEYRILQLLMSSPGRVVSREKLMEALWQTDSFVDENTLTVNVNRLRKKLETAGLKEFIRTKFGEGYLI